MIDEGLIHVFAPRIVSTEYCYRLKFKRRFDGFSRSFNSVLSKCLKNKYQFFEVWRIDQVDNPYLGANKTMVLKFNSKGMGRSE